MKEEILAKAQEENKGVDLVDKQAQKEGAWIAYFVAVLAIITVDLVNGFVLNNVNRGADFALFSMDQYSDICGLSTTHTHGSKCFMSGCIKESDLLTVDLYHVSTDMLCDTACLV